MSRMMTEAGVPPEQLAAPPWNNRLNAVLALGAVMMTIGFAYPGAGMSLVFVDDSVPQIVEINGP
jgi:uncharacterized iron-regulated membrane protein